MLFSTFYIHLLCCFLYRACTGRAQGVKGVTGISVELSRQHIFRIRLIKKWLDPRRSKPNITALLRFHNNLLYILHTGLWAESGLVTYRRYGPLLTNLISEFTTMQWVLRQNLKFNRDIILRICDEQFCVIERVSCVYSCIHCIRVSRFLLCCEITTWSDI